jgi:hypothetical protein
MLRAVGTLRCVFGDQRCRVLIRIRRGQSRGGCNYSGYTGRSICDVNRGNALDGNDCVQCKAGINGERRLDHGIYLTGRRGCQCRLSERGEGHCEDDGHTLEKHF